MTVAEISAEIERLARRRQEVWSGAPETGPQEVKEITARLAELTERRRVVDAQERAGDRGTIARRAKVESELERLSTPFSQL